ncbi:hypothetical protein [Nonomuraea sp. NPDC050786]|uniref:hypothetical protein n=1 Tax=Nonomuraea sp. NPDC050786 TaxID=3154840 RepID=UPI0033DD3E04
MRLELGDPVRLEPMRPNPVDPRGDQRERRHHPRDHPHPGPTAVIRHNDTTGRLIARSLTAYGH